MTVITGDEHVADAARRDLAAERVIMMPGAADPESLVPRIAALAPHILHVFCHGAVRDEQAVLELATVSDFDRGTSSVIVPAIELAHAAARTGTWLAHLNTCRSAQATGEQLTHAEEFVNTGVPVAIGMKRQINDTDAVAFSAMFYRSVYTRIAAILARGAGRHEMAWADTMVEARQKLRDMHVDDVAEADAWTVPVMYTRRGTFTLDIAAPGQSENDLQRAISETTVIDGLADLLAIDAPEVAADLRAAARR
nr:CHAT domain-containing protein [Nocardia bovistercoris]